MSTSILRLGYGTSRGADTYGYTIVRLVDETGGKTYRTMGGGYDMQGTVLADWLEDVHQDRLAKLADRAFYVVPAGGRVERTEDESSALYGMYRRELEGGSVSVTVDGACGVESVLRIMRAAGLEVTRTYKPAGRNRGETTGWLVEVSA